MGKLRIGLTMVMVLGIFGIYCGSVEAGLISQNFDLPGIHLRASADGYEERAYANYWGYLQQGVEERYYQYEYSNINFYAFEQDPGKFNFNSSWQFLIIGEENYTPDFNINVSQNSNVNAFGVSLYSNSSVRNYTHWEFRNSEWYPVITDDIELSFSFNLEPGRIENIGLWVNEWKWEEDPTRNTLWISFSGNGYFVPEPATVALLGLGGLFLRRRK